MNKPMNNFQLNMTTRFEALTSLRFFAAFIVLILHFGLGTSLAKASPGVFTAGPEMVTLFFVLSGFVLTLAYGEKRNISTYEYFINRTARIVPAYYLGLALMLILTAKHGLDTVDPFTLLLNVTFMQSWLPTYSHTLNYPAWTLSIEVGFYVIFPFLLVRAMRMRPRNVLLVALVLWAVTQCWMGYWLNTDWYKGYPSPSHDWLYFFPPIYLGIFALGIAGARLLPYFTKAEQPSELWSFTRTLIVWVITLFVLSHWRDAIKLLPFHVPDGGSLLAPLFVVFILQLSLGHDPLARIFSWGPFVLLGQAGYSFYILQVPVYRVFSKVLGPRLPDNADVQFWTFAAVLIVVSILSQRYVEIPASNLIRRLLPAKRLPNTSGAVVPVTNNNIAT